MSSNANPRRLLYLDALRGLAAVWVVIGHARSEAQTDGFLREGHVLGVLNYIAEGMAVPVFIALSGLLLTSPHCTWRKETWPGFLHFMKRRANRIYPAYIVAMLFVILATRFIPLLGAECTPRWVGAIPITTGAIVTHLVMIHNFFSQYSSAIDPPMWSLAVEWQIYIIFSAALIPLAHRRGTKGYFIGSLVAICAVFFLNHEWAILLGSFVLGSAGAWLSFGGSPKAELIVAKLPWGTMSILAGVVSLCTLSKYFVAMPMASISIVALLVFLINEQKSPDHKMTVLERLLESRPLKTLGWFSYSLYLVHYPILSLLAAYSLKAKLSDTTSCVLVLVVGPIVSLFASYLFAALYEHRVWPKFRKSAAQ